MSVILQVDGPHCHSTGTAARGQVKESKPETVVNTAGDSLEAVKPVEKQLDEVLAAQGPVIVKAEPEKKVPKVEYTAQPGSKMAQAIEIYKRMADKPRKEIIAAFVAEAGLTPAGSATYIANIRTRIRKGQV